MLNSALELLLSPLVLIVLTVAIGLTLVLFIVTGADKARKDPMLRLREQPKDHSARKQNLSRAKETGGWAKKTEAFKAFLEPAKAEEYGEARMQMVQAGYHGRNAVRDFNAAKFIMGVSGLLLGLGYNLAFPPAADASIIATLLPVMGPTLVGYYLPIYWVSKRREERQKQITGGFPDALDMLLICTEAGQSMDQSINRVAKELQAGYPALAEEFVTVSHQTKAGRDRLEVLKEMGERCGNADIRSFVTVLIQSATYGTSVADALRVYAAEMRDKRVMLAEEKANVLPTKLTLGTMMFTVPPLLIILIGPSVHGVITMLATADFSL
ncbi:type II secretion system F family protein [Pararhodobacter oceanensis]|uniref:Pilus assembly protein TadC n=1 Tax=Pararhodobacter oceanensis TaxID=2172121 RepID=A0A2T8HU93_9RHOB|nr:type II secretion system F family protein [Pararhodobacter oceanensis]PVH29030.1 pilus assembly protein TadC [Pararhodobacter oceanensis]